MKALEAAGLRGARPEVLPPAKSLRGFFDFDSYVKYEPPIKPEDGSNGNGNGKNHEGNTLYFPRPKDTIITSPEGLPGYYVCGFNKLGRTPKIDGDTIQFLARRTNNGHGP